MNNKTSDIIVDFEPISRRIIIDPGLTIYEILVESGIRLTSLCGGKGTCGKCKMIIQEGFEFLNKITNFEKTVLTQEERYQNYRLACQCKILKEKIEILQHRPDPQIRIFLPQELLLENFKILTSGMNKGVELNPAISKHFLFVKPPSLKEPIPDFERILKSIEESVENEKYSKKINIPLNILKKIPLTLRARDHGITLTIWKDSNIIDCEPGDTTRSNYGIAFDIGTTTLVGYLCNLTDGKIYALDSALNPQTAFGEDVVSRITYAAKNEESLTKLKAVVLEAMNKIIKSTCSMVGITPEQIYEAVIVGNSVMHHLFLGINPSYIGLSPYVPAVQRGLNLPAKETGLEISRDGNVYALPLIAGYVGADTMGVLISSELEKEKELTLAIDVGTNGEIIIGNTEILATGSCAAGSALEGAHISNGMRAASGSIDSVKIDPKTYEVSYTTINNKPPIGICGSGLIDIVAEMLKAKLITRSGNLNKEYTSLEQFIKTEKNTEFIVVPKDQSALNRDITISQKDIRELQMAKGAFYSGTRLILQNMNDLNDQNYEVKQVFLAGAFGNYINKINAKFIGMIPDIPEEKIYQIGNAAGIGSQNCLLNQKLRDKAQTLLKKINYVEIAIQPNFQKEFAHSLYFPHLNLDYFPNLKEYHEIPIR